MSLKRTPNIALGTLLCLLMISGVDTVHAQQEFLGAGTKGQLGFSVHDLVEKLAIVNTIMHVLILITLQFVQYLLQADFFTNPQMMSALNSIWRLSRDLMNVIFAVMLIGVALYTIVTANKKLVTENIMHFILAVLFVNFSWFYPRIIIDVANVLTATIYSVPQIMGSFGCNTFKPSGGTAPCKVVTDISLFGSEPQQATFCAALAGTPDCPCISGIACYKLDTYANVVAAGNMGVGHVMINGLIVNFTKILEMTKVPTALGGPGPITDGQKFVIDLQIIMIIAIAFLIQAAVILPLIGLVVGLLIRIVTIWVTTAFMPFTFLGLAINGKLGTSFPNFGFDVNIWDEFISAAFLPAMVALPITIGFVMLTTVTGVPSPDASFPMSWNIPLIAGFKSWWPLLWIGAAIGILWIGAFKALSKSKITSGITEKIRGMGESLFKAGLQLPLLTPLPMTGGRSMNIGGALNFPSRVGDAIRSSARSGIPLRQALAGTDTADTKNPLNPGSIKEVVKAIKNNSQQAQMSEKIVKAIQDMAKNPTNINISTQERANLIRDLQPLLTNMNVNPANPNMRDIMLRVQGVANTGEVGGLANDAIKKEIQKLLDAAK